MDKVLDVTIVGGLGHVGLPLGICLANEGLSVCLYDIDPDKADLVQKGSMPFIEYGAEAILKNVLKSGKLQVSLNIDIVAKSKFIIIAIGTPIDEYLNPKTRACLEICLQLKPYLDESQIIIIRSTVYPNTPQQLQDLLSKDEEVRHVAYCPERIVQGYAIKELKELPQIVAALSDRALDEASKLFSLLSPHIIQTSMKEAELVKLFTNAWRYIQFAVTNQFYMIAQTFGADYDQVRHAMTEGYGRAASLPSAGFAAGPCLLKDTMQLTAFNHNNFLLGHTAMMINEGLPNFIVESLKRKYNLKNMRVGILGMAFKADIDDIRDSLSYKLGKILRFNGADVLYSDEFAKDPTLISKEEIIKLSKIIIIGVPHSAYKGLLIPETIELVDLWKITKRDGERK